MEAGDWLWRPLKGRRRRSVATESQPLCVLISVSSALSGGLQVFTVLAFQCRPVEEGQSWGRVQHPNSLVGDAIFERGAIDYFNRYGRN